MAAILRLKQKIQSKISRIIYDRKKAIKRGRTNEASMLGMDKGILDYVIQLIDAEIEADKNLTESCPRCGAHKFKNHKMCTNLACEYEEK